MKNVDVFLCYIHEGKKTNCLIQTQTSLKQERRNHVYNYTQSDTNAATAQEQNIIKYLDNVSNPTILTLIAPKLSQPIDKAQPSCLVISPLWLICTFS